MFYLLYFHGNGLCDPYKPLGQLCCVVLVAEWREELTEVVVDGNIFGRKIVDEIFVELAVQFGGTGRDMLHQGVTQYAVDVVQGVAAPLHEVDDGFHE